MIQAESKQPGTVEVVQVTIPVSRRLKRVLEHLATVSSKTLHQFVFELIVDQVANLCDEPGEIAGFIKNHVVLLNDLQREIDGWRGKDDADGKHASQNESPSSIEFDDSVQVMLPDTFRDAIEVLCPVTKRDTVGLLRECLMVQLKDIHDAFGDDDDAWLSFISLDDDALDTLTREVVLIRDRMKGKKQGRDSKEP